MGSHSLLQGNFPTQGSNPHLLHWRQIPHCLNHRELCSQLLLDNNICSWMMIVTSVLDTAYCSRSSHTKRDYYPRFIAERWKWLAQGLMVTNWCRLDLNSRLTHGPPSPGFFPQCPAYPMVQTLQLSWPECFRSYTERLATWGRSCVCILLLVPLGGTHICHLRPPDNWCHTLVSSRNDANHTNHIGLTSPHLTSVQS